MVKLYEKSPKVLLVKDGFDWVNPGKSGRERPILLYGTSTLLVEGIMREGLRPQIPVLTPNRIKTTIAYFKSEAKRQDSINHKIMAEELRSQYHSYSNQSSKRILTAEREKSSACVAG